MRLEEAIQKIKRLNRFTFNPEQKAIAIRMLERAPKHEIKAWYDFIIQRVKLGFTFDTTTSSNYNNKQIAIVRQRSELNLIDAKLPEKIEQKLIIGENYDALKNLLLTHRNQIDIIYIDPPYNTEAAHGEGNTHVTRQGDYKSHFESMEKNKKIEEKVANGKSKLNYRDKFARTGWLNIMKERLDLARDLLTSSGVIFISIDDHEQAYLKVLMDEIFGEDNFVCNFIWNKTGWPKNGNRFVSDNHDYILCYRKSADLNKFDRLKRTDKNNEPYKYDDDDGRGPYLLTGLANKKNRGGGLIKKYNFTFKGHNPVKYAGWKFPKDKMEKLYQEKRISVPKDPEKGLRLKVYLSEVGPIISKTILDYQIVGSINENQKLLDQIFSDQQLQKFNYPKGVKLIKYLIRLVPDNKEAIVLDFFAGSGTTGHAVMELNHEDQGKRKFILVTNNENNIAEDVTYERLHRIIRGRSTKGKTNFKWLQKNQPFENNNLRVFEINYRDVSFRANLGNLESEAFQQLRKLNPNFEVNDDINIYYQLATLYPQNNSNGTN